MVNNDQSLPGQSDAASLQAYLHEHIPLTAAMQVAVVEAGWQRVIVSAPLAPNINHRDTVFGGSASTLAIVAAWSLLHVRLRHLGIVSRVVIQRNTMEYQRPIVGDFQSIATIENDGSWDKFMTILNRKSRSRISIKSELFCAGEVVGEFAGEFVAIADKA
ncbi:MAG: thioesterase domain-containing protein [Verrucomicrobiae bacterium]|nr:thioesterase domain-containing protein [Verrucomicrobiae bacterium]